MISHFNPQLGLLDMRTIQPEDEATITAKDRADWTGPPSRPAIGLRFNAAQHWYWVSNQQPEDLLVRRRVSARLNWPRSSNSGTLATTSPAPARTPPGTTRTRITRTPRFARASRSAWSLYTSSLD